MKQPIKAAVIGLGRVGYEFGLDPNRQQPASHFHCYQKLGAMLAVCENDPIRLQNAVVKIGLDMPEYEVLFFTDYNAMFREFQPEIVSICTPTPTHKEIALAAANCPSVKTIFLEKPIAESLADTDEIIRTCIDKNKTIAIDYARRWSKIYDDIRKKVPGTESMNLIGTHPGPLIRTGTHMIDLFNFICRSYTRVCQREEVFWDNVEVQAFGEAVTAPYMKDTEDLNINGHINYNNLPNVNATIFGNLNVPQDTVLYELSVITKDKMWIVKENGCRVEEYERRASKRYAKLNEYFRIFLRQDTQPENLLLNATTQLIETLNSHNSRTRAVMPCEGIDARRTLQIGLALHYSATHGNKPVKLKDVPYEYTVRSY